MKSKFLWPSMIVAVWTVAMAGLGDALGWSDQGVFAAAMLMVPVMILVVGLREGESEHHRRRPARR